MAAHPQDSSRAPRRVLVTGAASGLGLEFVRWYAVRGHRVLATDRIAPDEVPAGLLPDGATYRLLDVTRDEDWAAAMEWVQQTWGGLDVLVNNAGVAAGGRLDLIDMDEWHRVLDINLLGVVRGCRSALPLLRVQRGGTIVNVASVAGLVHAPSMASYNVSKAGVVALSETLRHELAPHGIQVSVVCPYFVRTNIANSMRSADPAAFAAARHYVDGARATPEVIVRRAMRAVEAGRFLVLTDAMGRVLSWGKRLAGPLYRRALRATT